jgi:molecular chaperone DnaJ
VEPDYYLVLGIAVDATADQIKAARNALARRYHADVAGNSSADHNAMVEVNAAYAVLSDPDQRREYDKRRAAARFAAAFKWPPPNTPAGAANARPKQRKKPAAKKPAAKKPAAKKPAPSPTEQAQKRVEQIRADFEKRMAELQQRSNRRVKKPTGLVMSLAENKISELMHENRTFEGLLMAVGAAFADKWLESKLKKKN